jgi:hypothetical protein
MAFCALPTLLEGHFYIGKTLLEVGFRHISPLKNHLQLQLLGGEARASERFRFSILRNGGGLFVGFEVLGFSSTFFYGKSRPILSRTCPKLNRAPRKVHENMVPFIPMDFSRVSGRKQRFLLVV